MQRDEYRASRIWYIIEAALEYFVSIMVTGAFLARITASLGFSDSLTGILSSFVSLGCVFQLASIRLFRNIRQVKKPALILDVINEVMFALVYLTPVFRLSSTAKTVLFLVCFCGAYLIKNLISSQKIDWHMSLVEDKQRGSFTAKKEIVSLLGGMTFTFLMGSLIDWLEEAGQQREAFIVGAVSVFILMALHAVSQVLIAEKPAVPRSSAEKTGFKVLLSDRALFKVVLVSLLWNIASHCATPFYGAYQIGELGFSMQFVSILSIMYSVVRVLVSPWLGRYADRHTFSRMVYLCFIVAAGAFLVNVFTVPGNGKVFYSIYYALYAISMGGINSSVTNLIFDYVHDSSKRRGALALNAAVGGVAGFLATCAMSPLVQSIQDHGNSLLGLSMYPAQFVSAVAFALTVVLILFVRFSVIGKKKEGKE